MRIYGLIGNPLGHSFSRRYFSQKFKYEHIDDCEYYNFEIIDLEKEIPELKMQSDIAGLNVTIPYKTAIIPYLDSLSDACEELNACNCIQIKDGKWIGHNTDIIGFENSFLSLKKPFHQKALILGTGGGAKAVAFILKKLQIPFRFVSRTVNSSTNTISYEEISKEVLDDFQIVINTTPLGMHPNSNDYPKIPYEFATKNHYFFDLIYNPAKTLFLALAEEQGALIENGDKMLVIQAEESWKIWNE
jgi:shikimate dehydrogenase